ncbi:hypothetical protein DRO29_01210 [Candidatus Bathyarchaeota archaeon]|nr:MAG: hypothetical protein DRO29_01210 [Candidatus Bathyarchaeota archaeon]
MLRILKTFFYFFIRRVDKMRLIKINGYYKISKGRLIQCRITEKPANIANILRWVYELRKEYKKAVKVRRTTVNGEDYLVVQRSDGIPFYVNVRTLDVYVPAKYRKHPLFATAIRYFLFYAGYKVRERTLIRFK